MICSSPYEYAEAYNFWYPGNGYSTEEMDALKTGKKRYQLARRNVPLRLVQNYKLAISGGSEKTQYYVSANYVNEEGVLRYSDNERYSARVNLNSAVTNWLTITTDVQFNHGVRMVILILLVKQTPFSMH